MIVVVSCFEWLLCWEEVTTLDSKKSAVATVGVIYPSLSVPVTCLPKALLEHCRVCELSWNLVAGFEKGLFFSNPLDLEKGFW